MRKLLTHLDAIIRGCFWATMPDPDCSSSTRCHFEPSLGSEGSDEPTRPPLLTLETSPRARTEQGNLFPPASGPPSKVQTRRGGLVPPIPRPPSKV